MRKTTLPSSLLPAVFLFSGAALLLVGGCGSGGGVTRVRADMSVGVDQGGGDQGTPDQGLADLAGPAADLAVPVDLAGPSVDLARPAATRIAAGSFELRTYTLDGWVIVSDGTGLSAVQIATGAVRPVARRGEIGVFGGSTVFVWHDGDAQTGVGRLTVWTAASGAHEMATDSQPYLGAASADGRYVAYFARRASGSATADLILDRADHSAPRTLVAGANVAACFPTMRVLGARLVAAHCNADATVATVRAYDLVGGAATDLIPKGYAAWSPDPAGARIVGRALGEVGVVVPVAGGAAVQLEADFGATARFLPAGDAIVYTKLSTGGLSRVAASGGAPTVLQTTGVKGIRALSPDGRFLMTWGARDPNTGLVDLYLTSAERASPPLALSATTTGEIFGEGFTPDGAWALYATGVDAQGLAGKFVAQPTSGAAPRAVASKNYTWWTAGGTRVVLNDNYQPVQGTNGRADIYVVDLAQPAAPTKLMAQVGADFFLSLDRKEVLYTVPGDGLYRMPLP